MCAAAAERSTVDYVKGALLLPLVVTGILLIAHVQAGK